MPCQDHLSAEPQDEDGTQGDQQGRGGHDLAPLLEYPELAVIQILVGGFEAADFMCLTGKGAHHLHPGDIFLQFGGELAQDIIDVQEQLADALAEAGGDHHQRNHRQQGNEGQQRVAGEQDHQDSDQQQGHPDQLDDAVTGKTLHRAHILDAAADQLAGLGMVVEAEGEALNVIVEPVAQVVSHEICQRFGLVALDKSQQRF